MVKQFLKCITGVGVSVWSMFILVLRISESMPISVIFISVLCVALIWTFTFLNSIELANKLKEVDAK